MSEIEERFHFAKLMLSQVRYLSDLSEELDKDPTSAASQLYRQSMKKSGHRDLPSPINQAVFLQMAYVNLVWLSEALTDDQRGELRNTIAIDEYDSFDLQKYTGEEGAGAYFRHIRNSLAHASVSLRGDEPFYFEFHSDGKGAIALSAPDLGHLSEKWCHGVSRLIYSD